MCPVVSESPVRTAQKTFSFSITATNWLMLYKDLIAVNSESRKQPTLYVDRTLILLV